MKYVVVRQDCLQCEGQYLQKNNTWGGYGTAQTFDGSSAVSALEVIIKERKYSYSISLVETE